jgi:NAD(P)-dependent dehydrogenase (short-subunit alcohol dehydrogenase family)
LTESRTVLTTGANSGLGLATTLELARRGFRSVGSVRSDAKAELVHEAADAAGLTVETVLLDIDDAARCAEVVDELRPWGLVNNAAFVEQRAVEEVDDDEARRHFETLVIAPMRLARLSLPHMRAAGGGRIVQVSSSAGRVTFPMLGWYQGAKHALEAVSDALRMEVAGTGVHVAIVEPGAFRSAVTHGMTSSEGTAADERYATAMKRARGGLGALERFWATPEQVAGVVAGALTTRFPRARYVVGYDALVNVVTQPFTPTSVRDRALRLLHGL